jgi:replication factor A1
MADVPLTASAIKAIYSAQSCPQPVLQIVDIKKVDPGQQQQSNQDRYRLLISDGVNYQQGMLGTQQNSLIKNGRLVNYSVVRLTEYVCNTTANNRRIIIILNLDVLSQAPALIGNPVNIENQMQGQALPPVAPINQNNSQNGHSYNNNNSSAPQHSNPSNSNSNSRSSQIVYNRPLGASQMGEPISKDKTTAEDLSRNSITPVNSLHPYQNRWTIKVRVTFKGEIKRYTNDRTKDGKLFHFDVVDSEKGEIRITMFNEIVDVFYPHIHQGNTYYISRGQLKFANKKFTNIKHEYELTLDRLSIVQQAIDDGTIGGIDFHFVPISAMHQKNKDDLVDVIGIVHKVDTRSSVKVQKQEREVAKRTLTLIDMEGASIDLTLWGQHADNVNEELLLTKPVLAVKGVKVSDFNTRTLNCSGSANLEWNPNLEEAHQLRAWYDANPSVEPSSVLSVSNRTGGYSGSGKSSRQNIPVKTFAQAKENPPANESTATDTFISRASVFRIPHNGNITYKACITKECKSKRVVEKPSGGYECVNCGEIPHCDERYILSVQAVDHTGFAYLSAFNDAALVLLNNTPANKLPNSKDIAAYDAVFNDAAFKMYRFTIRAKMEPYQGETRLKNTIIHIEPVNFLEESNRLLQEISLYN